MNCQNELRSFICCPERAKDTMDLVLSSEIRKDISNGLQRITAFQISLPFCLILRICAITLFGVRFYGSAKNVFGPLLSIARQAMTGRYNLFVR